MAGRKPDWTISALNPKTGVKGKVGAAWNNDDGTLQLKLNSFIVLQGSEELLIRLFPAERVQGALPLRQPTTPRDRMDPEGGIPGRKDLDDEIPF